MDIKILAVKIKIKSLAEEARIIRMEERKLKGRLPPEERHRIQYLSLHRKVQVRKAARLSQLAYGFLRGVPYRTIEPITRLSNALTPSDMLEISKMVNRYGKAGGSLNDLCKVTEAWMDQGQGPGWYYKSSHAIQNEFMARII